MITAPIQSSQLSNNTLQSFKSNKFLSLNNINIISRSSDGYINLNQLCKAGGKNFRKWKENKKSQAFLQVLSEGAGILPPSLIKYETNSKTDQANWGHPQVAINVAQWISPEFDVQVSKWVFELMLTGKVELGNEKTSQELENKLQELNDKYEKLHNVHKSLKYKRHYHELEKGNCVYVCHNQLEPPDRYKIGKTNDICKTLKVYRRNAPYTLLDYVYYTHKCSMLEDILLLKYIDERTPINHEIVENIKIEKIICDITTIVDFVKFPGSVGSIENIERYNADVITPELKLVDDESDIEIIYDESDESDESEDEETKKVIISRKCNTCMKDKVLNNKNFRVFGYGFKKRCLECDIESCKSTVNVRDDVKTEIKKGMKTVTCTKCKEELCVNDFYKNKANKNGLESQCKNCRIKGKNIIRNNGVLKPIRKINKKPIVKKGEKWCIECEKAKNHSEYRKATNRVDGLQSYCRDCDNARKRKNRMKNLIGIK